MQFKVFEPGIQVNGTSLACVVDGFRKYPSVATKYLTQYGFTKNNLFDKDTWYSLEDWLAACESIANEVGSNSLYGIGKTVPEKAVFPPHVTDIQAALASLDIAYHMNHKKNGEMMFSPETGQMLEGIGHYKIEAIPGENRLLVFCETPYPCEFDRGVITALANRFEPLARTAHDSEAPCRKNGADSCTFVVMW